jgi:hypothetical protein
MLRILSILTVLLLSGCVANTVPERLYEGPEKPASETVTLYPVPADVGSIMLYVDGKHPGNCFTNCAFIRPIVVLPGDRKFTGKIYAVPLKKGAVSPSFPADEKSAHLSTPVFGEGGLFADVSSMEHEESFEPGASYQLEFGFKNDSGQQLRYFWWKKRTP